MRRLAADWPASQAEVCDKVVQPEPFSPIHVRASGSAELTDEQAADADTYA